MKIPKVCFLRYFYESIFRFFSLGSSSLSSRLSSNSDDEKKSTNADTEGKLTPIVLAEHILSKSNLEQLFDTLITRPIFVANGCLFLDNIFDLLSRQMSVPICISLTSNENEQMQVEIKRMRKKVDFL